MSKDDYDLIRFDPGDPEHAAFVYDSFRSSTVGFPLGHPRHEECPGHWPWNAMNRVGVVNRFKHELAKPGTVTRIATVKGRPTRFVAWVAVRPPKTIVFAFTKHSSRRWGVATSICDDLGVQFLKGPVAVTFWTYASARIKAEHPGYDLFFDLTGEDVFQQEQAA